MKDFLTQLLKQPKSPVAIGSVLALFILIMIALGIIGGDEKTEPGHSPLAANPLKSQDQTLMIGNPTQSLGQLWQGKINSRQFIRIAPKFNARVTEILVRPGDRIKQGAHIAKLDDRDLKAAFQAAQSAQQAAAAEAVQATSEEKRMTELFQKEAATRQSFETAVARAQAARALAQEAASQTRQHQVQLSENDLIAPFDGMVGERFLEPGDMAIANQPVVSFYQENSYRLEAALPAQCTPFLKPHANITVKVESSNDSLTGELEEIAPELDPMTQTRQVKIALPYETTLQQGRVGWLELNCGSEEPILMIPETSILHFGQLEAVKIVNDQHWSIRHIRTGKKVQGQVEVLSGLKTGETLITNPGASE
jgi:RND family efflux transporter MFP subunit